MDILGVEFYKGVLSISISQNDIHMMIRTCEKFLSSIDVPVSVFSIWHSTAPSTQSSVHLTTLKFELQLPYEP